MPLFYSVNGKPSSYPIEPVAPVSPAPVFSAILAEELNGGADIGQGKQPKAESEEKSQLRGYGNLLKEPHRKRALTAQDIMSGKVCCIHAQSTASEVEALMRSRKFRHLPVVSKEGTLIGIVSDRDLARAAGDPSRVASTYMTGKVLTATRDTPIRHIADTLLHHRISALPIVDSDHLVVGILTTTDILRAIVTNAPIDLWV